MPTYTPIFVRSPFIKTQTGSAGDDTTCELYLWNDPSSEPGTATKTLTKPIPSSVTTEVYYDISPYCQEYINHVDFDSVSSDTAAAVGEYCYCTVKLYKNSVLQSTTYYICFNGFGYYEDGYNPDLGDVLLEEGTYYYDPDNISEIGGAYYFDDQTLTWSAVWTNLGSGATTTNAGLANVVGYIPYVVSAYAADGNTLDIKQNGITIKSFTFEPICEPKYTPVICDFVNKYGAWQRIIFFKASMQSYEATGTEFNLMPDAINYNIFV